ncbi:short-chain dehydrogenase [Alcanivorax sp. HI0044]|uniref:SDR family NAD(P)-dependent oxidoreductase n=3 Tax=unclassified Alcanivorax TaxID=2638842 RepID=UPI0007BAAE9E|nr:SDR family oxidoreductase [Alcanivorax sp. HI0044]KZY34605.1 short-chain dehydrogenase [Alcanivorax sp. HI0044]
MKAVLITGASAGIGEEFARQLATQGYNLVLAARRLDRLETLASELRQRHNLEVMCIASDLAQAGAAEKLVADMAAQKVELTGLINNAGFGDRGDFSDLPLQRQLDMIQVNVTALVDLTWRLMPQLKTARDAFVINVASTAAFQAGPNMSIYYASKAFVLSFSEGLHEELKKEGVAVSALCPGATASEFAQEANMTNTLLFKAGTMTTEAVVSKALAGRHRAIVIPGLKNLLMVWLGKLSPRMITRRLAGLLQA